ncbi:MAG: hypothetical protein CW691_09410 [Candidatus Bathyarchaeum sp.]|nr:MAG: hypothetical protein CW691_09410 [Candidatus Bathyarchaeum sp.]
MNRITKFLDNYNTPQTKRNFEKSILQYFEAIYDETNIENLEQVVEKYFNENRNVGEDIKKFLKSLNGLAPLTIKLKISNIKTFLIENDVELPQKFWKQLSRMIKGSKTVTLDKNPTNKELKQILLHVPLQGKALFLMLESSGTRIGELLKSNIEDLYLDEKPARIQIRGELTKTGNSRHVFFSREAKEALVEWLKVRDDYLEAAAKKSHIYNKKPEDSRIFPFDPSTAYSLWRNALNKAKLNGKDKNTGRERIHPHALRNFFRTRLTHAGLQLNVIETLMGHERYLTNVYKKYSLDDLRKFYLKAESALFIFTEAQEVTKLRKEIENNNKSIQTLVTELTKKNLTLENKISNIEKENRKTKEEIKNLNVTIKSLVKQLGINIS